MPHPLRLGVVGANPSVGWASRSHLPAVLALPEYELVAVCTTKRESAQAAAQKYGARRFYWSYRDLVADPDVDVVDVCVRVPYHFEIVMAALEAGKHVYCEWPLAATLPQAVKMAELSASKGLHTMVGLQARGAPSIGYLRQLIGEGWIGRVHAATLTQLSSGLFQERAPESAWRAERANGAHTLSISAGHAIDAFCWCLGPLVEVAGIVDTLAPEWRLQGGGTVRVTAPDYVTLTGRLGSGAVATVTVGSVPWHAAGFRMEVFGTAGTLVATGLANQVQAMGVRLQGARHDEPRLVDLEVPAEHRWVPDDVPGGTPVNVAQMLRRFAQGIQSGTHPEPTFADAVRNHRLLDAIVRASVSGTAVKVQG